MLSTVTAEQELRRRFQVSPPQLQGNPSVSRCMVSGASTPVVGTAADRAQRERHTQHALPDRHLRKHAIDEVRRPRSRSEVRWLVVPFTGDAQRCCVRWVQRDAGAGHGRSSPRSRRRSP